MKRKAATAATPSPRGNASTLQRFNLSLTNRQRTRPIGLPLLRRIVRTLLGELVQIEQVDLGICLVAAPEMARLNETFLRHAGSTDVLAFDYAEHATRNAVHAVHGEVFVCVDEAVAQARRYRTSWQAELVRYVVHGVLHLRGFDDRTPAARRRMKSAEDRLVGALARRFTLSDLGRP